MSRWNLVELRDGGRQTRRLLADGEQILGSSADADLRLDHPTVSRRHARLTSSEEAVLVEDLGSSNGTFLESKRLDSKHLVEAGQALRFGTVACTLERVAPEENEAAIQWTDRAGHPAAAVDEVATSLGDPSTFSVGSLHELVRQALPQLVQHLEVHRHAPDGERRATATAVQQAAGRALFQSLPCRRVELCLGKERDALLFQATRGDAKEDKDGTGPIEVQAGGLVARIWPAAGLEPRGFTPWISLVTRLAALVLEPLALEPVEPARTTPDLDDGAPELPAPASVEPAVQKIYAQAARLARGDVSVLIGGETGTGKEVLARYLHDASPRAKRPWVAVNCAALPDELLESELFGIEKGVATGVEARPGKFEQADGGTLFLDEIGDMSLPTQAKILRVLQDGEVYRLGARATRPARARIVAATNRDLEAMIENGAFRLDLFHRIADARLDLPPLRRRPADLPSLAGHFLTRAAEKSGVRARGISRAALDAMTDYAWPGNVRQLERQMIRAALFLEDGELLQTRHLGPEIIGSRTDEDAGSGLGRDAADQTLKARLESFERRILREVLRRHDGNVRAAAGELGVGRTTLYRRLGELEIET